MKVALGLLVALCTLGSWAAPCGPGPGRGCRPGPCPAPRPCPPPRPHHPPPPPPHHHCSDGVAVAAGFVSGAIVGAALSQATTPATTVVATPTVVTTPVVQQTTVATPAVQQTVVQQPVTVQQSSQAVAVQPVQQVQKVWVEGGYVDQVQANGTTIRVYQQGHYEDRVITQ